MKNRQKIIWRTRKTQTICQIHDLLANNIVIKKCFIDRCRTYNTFLIFTKHEDSLRSFKKCFLKLLVNFLLSKRYNLLLFHFIFLWSSFRLVLDSSNSKKNMASTSKCCLMAYYRVSHQYCHSCVGHPVLQGRIMCMYY